MKERKAVNESCKITREMPNNRLLKGIMPLLSAIYGLCLSLACGFFLEEDADVWRYLLSNILELIGIIVTLAVVKKALPKWLPNTENYTIMFPDMNAMLAIIFFMPAWVILKYRLIYFITAIDSPVVFETLEYSAKELKDELIASVSAVFLAPITEEICFRYSSLSIYSKKRTRITVCIVMALFFGIIHVRNMVAVFLDALLFGFMFLKCKNIGISIFAHAFSNFLVTALAVMAFFGVEIYVSREGPLILLISPLWSVIMILFGIIGIGIQVFFRPYFKNLKMNK